MHQSTRPALSSTHPDETMRDRRDPVVVHAIATVAARQSVEGWWAMAPSVRTHAIYEEIKRIDRAWADEMA
jgi:hypothetical protein